MKNQIRFLSVAIIAICFFSCSKTSKVYIELVNPNATQKAKNLYYFIQDIQGKYTLSGQHNFCGKGKPIALGEVGEIPTDEILQQQSRWSWYMPWGWILFVSNKPDEIKNLMNSERVLTLDEINTDKKGRYSLKTN